MLFKHVSRSIVLLLFLVGTKKAAAQYSEIINSDRPGATLSASSLGNRVLQWQVGGEYGQLRYSPRTTLQYSPGSVSNQNGGGFVYAMHYGLTERFDLGGSITYSQTNTIETRISRINTQLTYSIWTRGNILKRDGFIPAVAIQGEILLPDSETEFYNYNIGGKITLMTDQKLGGRTLLSSNLGVRLGGVPIGFYTLQLKIIASQVTFLYVEHFGEFGTNYERFPQDDEVKSRLWYAGIDGGMGFIVHRNVQIDLYAGYASWAVAPLPRYQWFAGVGLSWRVKFKKKEKPADSPTSKG